MNREEYLKEYPLHQDMRDKVKEDKNRLHYHLMPPTGWLNDPNGLCRFKGENHIYFQYTPFETGWGMKLWGHYSTKDWINFQQEEPFLYSDTPWDRDGAYSGSAFAAGDRVHYFYTGNVKHKDKEYDYITEGREQNTIHVSSKDARTASEKKLLMTNADYPSDMTRHVRDPKVFERNGKYYMIQGARDCKDHGCALLFSSDDLESWIYFARICTEEPFGFMWECPDLIEIEGQWILMACVQGVDQIGHDYQNIYQTGYFILDADFEKKEFHVKEFVELDKGFDIYACQTFDDDKGRKIQIGWMGMPDTEYRYDVTAEYGWIHALTMPRVLSFKNGRVYQQPLEEMQELRKKSYSYTIKSFSGWETDDCCFEFNLSFGNQNPEEFKLRLRNDVWLEYSDGILYLKLGKSGYGRDQRTAVIPSIDSLQIFSDTSSVEIFVNGGEITLTTRVFSDELHQKINLEVSGDIDGEIKIYDLGGYIYK